MISLESVSKSFPSDHTHHRHILRDVSFHFPSHNLAVLGRNGAGKSTLLRLIAGIEEPDRGKVLRQGSVSWPIGFRGSFHRELSAAENIRFVARIYGQDTRYVTEYVREFAEIGPFFEKPIKTYSTGMVARLAFGLSMAISFDVYLVDELLAVGDARFKEKCHERFKDKHANSQIIMVSHMPKTLRDYCDAAVLLDQGSLRYFDNLDEAFAVYEELNAAPMKF